MRESLPTPHESLTEDSTLPEGISAALDRFESFADGRTYYPPNMPLICSLGGEVVPIHRSLGGSYWRRHLLAPCQEKKCFETLRETQCDLLLELGPGPIAGAMVGETSPDGALRCLSSVQDGEDPGESLLRALGSLYVAGANPNFQALDNQGARRRVRLPGYPFQKRRYWITDVGRYMTQTKTLDK
jgi:acyl transferase domain-containing protein